MSEPTVVPRADHSLSRRDIDPAALKVLYRLHSANHIAYLVGGSVRDLLLERRPKDFDVGTSAHPYEIKRLFRNCWIIGRRFRLAHVKFGPKTIEVATFRRNVPPELSVPDEAPVVSPERGGPAGHEGERLIRRDNTFGTPEEDAFRRDFTVNALFYDIASFSIIDYVGGLEDLKARVIRSIGDPDERFQEDPVRMLRAIVLAARLDFSIDARTLEAIVRRGPLIAQAAPARLIEEYYKVLRSGSAARAFGDLKAYGLLRHLTPELDEALDDKLGHSLEALDAYRRGFAEAPEALRNPVLLATLLAPIGRAPHPAGRGRISLRRDGDVASLGVLPLARRDMERLGQLLVLARRLFDIEMSPRAQHALTQRSAFPDALTWLEIHGHDERLVEHWRRVAGGTQPAAGDEGTRPRRRRRRRRRPSRSRAER